MDDGWIDIDNKTTNDNDIGDDNNFNTATAANATKRCCKYGVKDIQC